MSPTASPLLPSAVWATSLSRQTDRFVPVTALCRSPTTRSNIRWCFWMPYRASSVRANCPAHSATGTSDRQCRLQSASVWSSTRPGSGDTLGRSGKCLWSRWPCEPALQCCLNQVREFAGTDPSSSRTRVIPVWTVQRKTRHSPVSWGTALAVRCCSKLVWRVESRLLHFGQEHLLSSWRDFSFYWSRIFGCEVIFASGKFDFLSFAKGSLLFSTCQSCWNPMIAAY